MSERSITLHDSGCHTALLLDGWGGVGGGWGWGYLVLKKISSAKEYVLKVDGKEKTCISD